MPYSGSLIWLLLDLAGHRCQPVLRRNAARAEIDEVLVLLERSRENLARQRLAVSVGTHSRWHRVDGQPEKMLPHTAQRRFCHPDQFARGRFHRLIVWKMLCHIG